MGKGDKKTAKGKRVMGSYGVTRKRKESLPNKPAEPKPAKAEAVKEKKTVAKKPAAKKPVAKKPATKKAPKASE